MSSLTTPSFIIIISVVLKKEEFWETDWGLQWARPW